MSRQIFFLFIIKKAKASEVEVWLASFKEFFLALFLNAFVASCSISMFNEY